jgi:hypothetical protein
MKDRVAQFVQACDDLLEALEHFPAHKIEEPVCGTWDLRCVLAHIAGWDGYFIEIVERLRAGEKVPYWGDMDAFNEVLVEERKDRTWDEVKDEFVKVGEDFIAMYSGLEEELWSKRLWEQGKPTPAWVVEINAEHYRDHLEEIDKKLEE